MKSRIAVVTTSYPSAQDDVAGHFVRSEVLALTAAGHHVTVLCPGAPSSADTWTPAGSVTVRLGATAVFGWPGALTNLARRPWASAQLPIFFRRCRSVLRRGEFDRVVAHWLLGSGWPIALAGQAPTEVVVHGSDARLLAKLSPPLRTFILNALRARGVTLRLVAPHLKQYLRTRDNGSWLDAAIIAPSPLCVPALPSREQLRAERGLSNAEPLALVVGRLVPSKRVDVALRRAPLPPGVRLVVIGSGPLQSVLTRAYPHVHFTGQLDRLQTLGWIKAADWVLSASLDEGAPSALREARLLGVPVITAEFGSARAWAAADPGVRVTTAFSGNG